jgi:protein-S-isoprenylcysteine O-methyltransferase Ste14
MGLLKTLLELVGILMIIGGVIFIAVGVYGLAGGTGITFTINDRMVTAQEGGQIFSIIGVVLLFVGIALTYIGFRKMK